MGIGSAGLWSIGLAVAPTVLAFLMRDPLRGILTGVMLSPLVAGGLIKHHGIPLTVWSWWATRFQIRKAVGMTKYRKLPKPRVLGQLELPQLNSRLEVWETDTGRAVIWDKKLRTASVTCIVASPGMAHHQTQTMTLLERQELTAALMSVAGSWTRRRQISRVTFLERTRPGSVVQERRAFEALAATGPLADSYAEALTLAEDAAVMRPQAITITINAKSAAGSEAIKQHGGGKAGVLAMVEQEMGASTESLSQAGFTRVAWCSPREWGGWGRTIVDPVSEAKVDVRIGTAFAGVAPEIAGPMSFDEQKDHVETDSAFHRVYWIEEWPRLDVLPGFMGDVAFAETYAGVPVRHTLQIVGAPIPLEKALKRIRDDKKTWKQNARLRARRGQESSIADDTDWQNLEGRERDLIDGQGELAWTGFIVVSALSLDALHVSCSSMEITAAQASIEMMPLTYQQGAALMAAAYPAGLGAR